MYYRPKYKIQIMQKSYMKAWESLHDLRLDKTLLDVTPNAQWFEPQIELWLAWGVLGIWKGGQLLTEKFERNLWASEPTQDEMNWL